MKEGLFLDLDYMPPSPERLFTVIKEMPVPERKQIIVRCIENFPWSFDSRMLADAAYNDQVILHLYELCSEKGLDAVFLVPGPADMGWLLRTEGYRRLCSDTGRLRVFDPEAPGARCLMRNVIEDMAELLPEAKAFALDLGRCQIRPEFIDGYRNLAESLLTDEEIDFFSVCADCGMVFCEKFMQQAGIQDAPGKVFMESVERFENAENEAAVAVSRLHATAVMNMRRPGKNGSRGNCLSGIHQNAATAVRGLAEASVAVAENSGNLINRAWLDSYLEAVNLAVEELLGIAETRLRQCGFLV